ncbi:MAG: site-specific integrase, partial [Pseudomonadota bacterium]
SVPDTMEQLTTTRPAALLPADLETKIGGYISASKSHNTRRAYRAGWRAFTAWCRRHDLGFLPAAPVTVAAYVADRAGELKVSTLELRLSAIRHAHDLAGHDSPTNSREVAVVMQGIRRQHGRTPKKKHALLVGDIMAIAGRLSEDLRGHRDRALLLLGFCGGFRRSELVGLDVGDIDFRAEGLTVTIRKAKTDQDSVGRTIGIGHGANELTCPVTAIRRWLTASGLTGGPLFRAIDRHGLLRRGRLTDRSVARIVKRLGGQVGLDPKVLGGHSLRSGFATSAAAAGIEEREIARQTGHRSLVVLRGYIQQGTAFDGDVVRRLGL